MIIRSQENNDQEGEGGGGGLVHCFLRGSNPNFLGFVFIFVSYIFAFFFLELLFLNSFLKTCR